MVTDHDSLLKGFVNGEHSILVRVFENGNVHVTVIAAEWHAEWDFHNVWQVSEPVRLVSRLVPISANRCKGVSIAQTGVIALGEVTLAAVSVAIVRLSLNHSSENTVCKFHNIEEVPWLCRGLNFWLFSICWLKMRVFWFFNSLWLLEFGSNILHLLEWAANDSWSRSHCEAERFSCTMGQSTQSWNSDLDSCLFVIFHFVVEPFVIVQPLFNETFHFLKRGILQRLEVPDEVDQVSVLLEDTREVLPLLFLLDSFKLGLEVECVSHLVEQKR